jgi:hypothetical protein
VSFATITFCVASQRVFVVVVVVVYFVIHSVRKLSDTLSYFIMFLIYSTQTTQPSIQRVTNVLSTRIKRPDRETGHASSCRREFKNECSLTSTPLIYFCGTVDSLGTGETLLLFLACHRRNILASVL